MVQYTTFQNLNESRIDICNAFGVTVGRLGANETRTVNTTGGRTFYFKRAWDNKVTDHYRYWHGQIVIDAAGVRARAGDKIKPFRAALLG